LFSVKKAPRQRQRARCTSPYSTDSNYSAVIPHRPYPKSDRRRQLREHGGRYSDQQTTPPSGGDTPGSSLGGYQDAKLRPPVLAKPQLSSKPCRQILNTVTLVDKSRTKTNDQPTVFL